MMEYQDRVILQKMIVEVLETHEYEREGRCSCGKAIGYSDGLSWSTFENVHLSAEIIEVIENSGVTERTEK